MGFSFTSQQQGGEKDEETPSPSQVSNALVRRIADDGTIIVSMDPTRDFGVIVASILHQAAPSYPKANLVADVCSFLDTSFITNEEGLATITEDDLPLRQPKTVWQVLPIRRAMVMVARCAENFLLESTTSLAAIRRQDKIPLQAISSNNDSNNKETVEEGKNSAMRKQCCAALTGFILRPFLWNLPLTVKLSQKEEKNIDKAIGSLSSSASLDDTHDHDDVILNKLRTILAWRATLILAIIPFGIVVNVLNIIKTHHMFDYYSDLEYEYKLDFNLMSGLGRMSLISSENVSESVMLLGLFVALYYRFNLPRSTTILRWSFILQLFIKLWPSIIQSDARLNFDKFFDGYDDDYLENYRSSFIANLRFTATLKNGIDLVPLIIAFPRGVIGAGLAMLAVDPSAITPKVLLLYFFPFATLLLVLGTSSMIQAAGDTLLALSLVCFYASDLLMYFLFGAVLAGKVEDLSSGWRAKARLSTKILGSILFFTWAMVVVIPCRSWYNRDEVHCMVLQSIDFTVINIFNIVFSFFRNLLLTKLIFADFIISTMDKCEQNILGFADLYRKEGKEKMMKANESKENATSNQKMTQ